VPSELKQSGRDTRIAGQLLESLLLTLDVLDRHRQKIAATLDRRR
jgi:hypothetical protein